MLRAVWPLPLALLSCVGPGEELEPSVRWAQPIGTDLDDVAHAIAAMPSGDVAIVYRAGGLYVARFDEEGEELNRNTIDADPIIVRAAALGEALVIAGTFAEGSRLFVLDSAGDQIVERALEVVTVKGLAAHDGEIYLSATTTAGASYFGLDTDGQTNWRHDVEGAAAGAIGAGPLGVFASGTDGDDPFLVRLSPDLETRRFAGSGQQEIGAIAVSDEAVTIGGSIRAPFDLGGGPLRTFGRTDFYVADLGPDLTHRASRAYGDAEIDVLRSIVVDEQGRTFLAGTFAGSLEGVTSRGGTDLFVGQRDGDFLRFGDEADQATQALVGASGRLYLLGVFVSQLDLDVAAFESVGGYDVILIRFR